jgi:hypothetical protein
MSASVKHLYAYLMDEMAEDNSNLRNYKVQLSSIVTYNVPIIDDAANFQIKRICGDLSIRFLILCCA